MKSRNFCSSILVNKILDLVVLGSTFFVTCSILPGSVNSDILLLTVVYSGVLYISVRIGKHLLSSEFSSLTAVLKLMLNNAVGLLVGASIMLILGLIIPGFSEFSVVIIIASVMAFFVLGTLTPLIRLDKHTHQ